MLFCVLFEVFLYIVVTKMYSSVIIYKLHYFAFSIACKVTILQPVVAMFFITAYSSLNDISLIYRVEGQIRHSSLYIPCLEHTGCHLLLLQYQLYPSQSGSWLPNT